MERDPELKDFGATPRPGLQDVVKVDGRWAQTWGGGDTIKYLETGETADVNWDDYVLVSRPETSVRNLMDFGGGSFSDTEQQNIVWGSEQEDHPELRLDVIVFGEYTKK